MQHPLLSTKKSMVSDWEQYWYECIPYIRVFFFFFFLMFIWILSARLDESAGYIRLLPRLLRGQIVLSQLERIALRSLTAWDYDGHQQHTWGHGVTFRHQWCRKSSEVKWNVENSTLDVEHRWLVNSLSGKVERRSSHIMCFHHWG